MSTLRALSTGIALAALVLAAPSPAETPSGSATRPATVAPVEPAAAVADTLPAARHPSPMMLEVRAALERERERTETLRARLRERPGGQEALALQREIERVKLDTEVAILRIQAGAARKAGRTAQAERLEAAAADLLAPPPATAPVARPAPRAAVR